MNNHEWAFPKCPVCGGEGVIAETLAGLVSEGRLPEKATGQLFAAEIAFKAPSALTGKIPVVGAAFDVCAKCGTFWAIRAQRIEVEAQAQAPKLVVPHLKANGRPA